MFCKGVLKQLTLRNKYSWTHKKRIIVFRLQVSLLVELQWDKMWKLHWWRIWHGTHISDCGIDTKLLIGVFRHIWGTRHFQSLILIIFSIFFSLLLATISIVVAVRKRTQGSQISNASLTRNHDLYWKVISSNLAIAETEQKRERIPPFLKRGDVVMNGEKFRPEEDMFKS